MLSRPDPQSFTKFALSAGVFLVVAAFVVPGLILRETDVLRISKRDLAGLTPTARKELQRRQGIARDAGHLAPYLAGLFLLGGALLIGFGTPRLKEQEEKDDERSSMEMDKLRIELKPQTASEREERLRADAEEDLGEISLTGLGEDGGPSKVEAPSPDANERRPPSGTLDESEHDSAPSLAARKAPPPSGRYFGEEVSRRARAEAEVLERIAALAPPWYDFKPQIKIEGASNLLLDGLLVSEIDQLRDILVEIKVVGHSLRNNARNWVAGAAAQLLRYQTHFQRPSIGWIIFYVYEPVNARDRARIEELVEEYGPNLRVSIVDADDLWRLALPLSS